eukprot:CAMPEP_0185760882 /NCGR_PEP_ID=MMETSP1174-20130828/19796_1 /TAXON_ID=35687 /ORGANISM="Dictyocha speculum, Strain CCMP1381" /LENGTH=476 /DNA_ID=CAMNT_0028441877 /DNA_START=147 /DNA_END=1577 /DNA_ORIENTATION=+
MASGQQGFLQSYPDDEGPASEKSNKTKYLIAMYWALTTITTVGYGDILPSSDREIGITMFAMIVGCSYYAYVIALISSVVGQDSIQNIKYFDRMEIITDWANAHNMDPALRREIQQYFREVLKSRPYEEEQSILKDMPPDLRNKVGAVLIPDNVRFLYLFNHIHPSNLAKMVSIIKFVHIEEGGILVRSNEVGHSMFIVEDGVVNKKASAVADAKSSNRLSKLGRHISPHELLRNGESFGEEVALSLFKHYSYTVAALIKTTLHMIPANDLSILFSSTPDILEAMIENFRRRYDISANNAAKFGANKRISSIFGGSSGVPPGYPEQVIKLLNEIKDSLCTNGEGAENKRRMSLNSPTPEGLQKASSPFGAVKDEIINARTTSFDAVKYEIANARSRPPLKSTRQIFSMKALPLMKRSSLPSFNRWRSTSQSSLNPGKGSPSNFASPKEGNSSKFASAMETELPDRKLSYVREQESV